MVGGVVVGITRLSDKTHVHVADCPHYPKHENGIKCPRPDTCCVYTDEVHNGSTVEISIGDSFWWQSGHCYWTPKESPRSKCGKDFDIKLTKIGYSH